MTRQQSQRPLIRLAPNGGFLSVIWQRGGLPGALMALVMSSLSAASDPWKAASALVKAGKSQEAVAAYSKLIVQQPDDTRGYIGRGWARRLLREYDGAIADYDKAIALAPEDAGAYNHRALAYDESGRRERALQDFDRAIELNPANAIFHYNRASTWSALSQPDKAIADHSKALGLNPKYGPAYTSRGNLLVRQGDYEGALADFAQAIALDERNVNAYLSRASAYDAKGEDAKALADFNEAAALDPKSPKIYNNLGFFLETQGKHDEAIANYTKAIDLLPTFATYYNGRGNCWLSMGEYAKAMTDFDKAIELDPESAKAYRNRAAAWLVQGEFDKAVADSSRSVKLNPQEARSFCIRSEAREALGDSAGAKEDAARALVLGPQPPFGVAVAVPPSLMAREEQTLKALLASDTPQTRTQLAAVRHAHAFAILEQPRAESSKGALEEAVAYAKSATVLEPANAGHWFLTGMLFRKLSGLDERAAAMAEQALRQAVEVDADHAASWLELGLMMAAQERGREAMTALEHALASDPARTAAAATGLLCAMYALNDEGWRGIDFLQDLHAGNPEVSALGVGAAIMLDHLGDREAALEQARDIMLIENAGTPDHAAAAKLVKEWEGATP